MRQAMARIQTRD